MVVTLKVELIYIKILMIIKCVVEYSYVAF